MKTPLWFIAGLFALPCIGLAADLEKEVPILVAGEPLDVKHEGDASPLVVDYDGDGKKDLLVRDAIRIGNNATGYIRMYRNAGTSGEPRFEKFRFFEEGAASSYLPVSGASTAPQLADLDGDGQRDLFVPGWPFEIRIHRGGPGGISTEGEMLLGRDLLGIDGSHTAISLADWDGDGDLDLVVGGGLQEPLVGNVCLLRNVGTAKQFEFAKPESLLADGKPILSANYSATPAIADWDADGKPDLVMGCGDGSVVWFRNVGSRGEPKLAAAETLVLPPAGLTDRGKQAKPCVVDWNDDGRLDLVVGDYGSQFENVLTEEETAMQAEARAKQAEVFTTWAKAFDRYRKLAADAKDPGAAELFKAEIAQLRDELVRLNRQRERWFLQEQAFQPGRQIHGRVWLFLRAAK